MAPWPARALRLCLALSLGCGAKDEAPVGEIGGAADTAADTGGAVAPAECADGAPLTWDSFGDGFFRTYCTACHSRTTPDRHGAPAGVDFDQEGDALTWGARVRARALEAQTMPIGGGIPEDDRLLLDRYLCGLGS